MIHQKKRSKYAVIAVLKAFFTKSRFSGKIIDFCRIKTYSVK